MNSILMAILGGLLIGLSASGMMYFIGRVAGISGICAGILSPKMGDTDWRVAFLGGLLAGGLLLISRPKRFRFHKIAAPKH